MCRQMAHLVADSGNNIPQNYTPTRLRVYSGQTPGLLRLNSEFAPTKLKHPTLHGAKWGDFWGETPDAESIELEVAAGVVVGDVLDHLAQQLAVVRQQALLDIVAQQVAEDAAEVLVARIAEERAAVGKHAHEA